MRAEDDTIATRIRRGERGAFAAFYAAFARPLHRHLAGMVGERALAEDLLQETMLRVFETIERYEERGAFRAWVFRIATNQAYSALRRRRIAAVEPLEDAALSVEDSSAVDHGDRLATADRARRIEAAIAGLPEEQRAVFLLRVRQEMDVAEVARTLCVPEGTVKSRMFHAVRKLRACVEASEPPDEERRA